MQWQFLDPDLAAFEAFFPDSDSCAISMCRIADHEGDLFPQELEALGSMLRKRRDGFSSGRHCAHLVQQQLNLQEQPVLRRERAPLWPDHSVGSITHSDEIAAAIASTAHRGVGIDVEQAHRLEEKLYRVLFTEAEQAAFGQYDFDAATVVFSAKEAGYKSIYPQVGKYIGFMEAQIHLDAASQRFTIEYIGDHAPNRLLDSGVGYWREADGHILTVFLIP